MQIDWFKECELEIFNIQKRIWLNENRDVINRDRIERGRHRDRVRGIQREGYRKRDTERKREREKERKRDREK